MTPAKTEARTVPKMATEFAQDAINVYSRVSALETSMERLTQDVKNLADIMRDQSTSMSMALEKAVTEFRRDLASLTTELGRVKAPKLSLWLAIGAFLFTILTATMGIFLAPLYMNQNYYAQNLDKHSEYVKEKMASMGDEIKERTQQVSTNTRNVDKINQQVHLLDVKLHYEKEITNTKFTSIQRILDLIYTKTFPELGHLKSITDPPVLNSIPVEPSSDLR